MFAAQRISRIQEILLERKSVNTATLCDELQVSDVTVRKYLDQLEKEGFLKKFHGGAVLVENDMLTVPPSDGEDCAVVDQIAKLTVNLVEDGDSIFLGSGPFGTALAKKLENVRNLSVITNNVNALPYLTKNCADLSFIGGSIYSQNEYLFSCGNKAIRQLDNVFVQKAFYSVDGIDLMSGISVMSPEMCEFLNRINAITKDIYIMADHRRFDKICMHTLTDFSDHSSFISDQKLPSKYKSYFFDHNIRILTAYDV